MVANSNVGFNKADPNVARSISYEVDLATEKGPQARLTLTYRNHSTRTVETCIQESRYGDTYADMMNRCYWDYVRVYVPPGSELIEGPALPLPAGSLLARNSDVGARPAISPTLETWQWTVWTAFFDLEPGAERKLTFDYQLPGWVLDYEPGGLVRYRLVVQKQPGTEAVPLRVAVSLPQGAGLIDAQPAGLSVQEDGSISTSTDLRTDREFEIVFRRGDMAP
jgi:hypothetical protein